MQPIDPNRYSIAVGLVTLKNNERKQTLSAWIGWYEGERASSKFSDGEAAS